ncbi:MAG: HAD-IB family phosphatase [bacterium]|nr:HAD-IB family phosphatase [bacterium]
MSNYIGIDLAGSPNKETGVSLLRDNEITEISTLRSDKDIIEFVVSRKPTLTAIDAPLTLPTGKDGTYGSRKCDRILQGMKSRYCCNPNFSPFSPTLIAPLMLRGYHLKKRLKDNGISDIIEIHPGTTIEFLDLSITKKDRRYWSMEDWRLLYLNLKNYLRLQRWSDTITPHMIDAVIASLTAKLYNEGRAKDIGDEEGKITVPLPVKVSLCLFDMDGTLTEVVSPWEYLHRKFSLWDGKGEVYLDRYLSHKISYEQFVEFDTSLWQGKRRSEIEEALDEIPFVEGLEETFKRLRNDGIKIAILSTGFSYLGKRIKRKVGIDDIRVYANELMYDESDWFKGVKINVSNDPDSKRGKKDLVREICNEIKTSPVNTVAIGDGSSDKEMFESCGLSILFNDRGTKDIEVDYHIKGGNLTSILKCLPRS